jgi:type I restriction enzyme M protein
MLDDVTKKRINTLRQILVGKLPDPKAQVEQITNGLIYKFMNDMDEQSLSMGGKSTYFSGKFQKYSWKNLMDTKTSGVEKIKLYSDAIEQMYTNENLPELFREIFKNSFLPFKDPSTLNMFLKEINEFHYSNSEKLGDAFEYLLSFMGSQGDAGQFRTPRHIIDFIVEIVNPQKNETILDPSCGTAGFLISSYKHILNQNTKKNLGDGLTASDRKKIGENLNGYDISPDMVKMSLVNMYLHKFTNPKINEYDTLSSEDRWNEYYDVILANPPFFSPKGGITPHNRFGVKSTKAEVLFIDYINEHLKPNGRAGIIIPEGVIFQTGTAYKQLRKRLIETSLTGVISLPAGVFQPYSGVKTSILILDKDKNKKDEDIFFAKVDNDGFSLGSQRNKIKKNDLPFILNFIREKKETNNCFFINKNKITTEESVSFSSSKYQNNEKIVSKFDIVKIIETFDLLSPKTKVNNKDFLEIGKIPIVDQSNKFISGYWNNTKDKIEITQPVIIFGDHTRVIKYINFDFVAGADGIKILIPKSNILPRYLFHVLKSLDIESLGYSRHYKQLKEKEIPLPPIEIQNQIVEELDGYQKIIDGCIQVIENYKPSIDIDPSWEMVELEKISNKITDGTHKTPEYTVDGVPFLRVTDITKSDGSKKFISKEEHKELIKRCNPEKGDILYSKNGTIGISQIVDWDYEFSIFVSLCLIKPNKEKVLPGYLGEILNTTFVFNQAKNLTKTGTVSNLHLIEIKKLKIPLPDLDTQKLIFEEIKNQKKMINSNLELKQFFENKINNLINSLWSN